MKSISKSPNSIGASDCIYTVTRHSQNRIFSCSEVSRESLTSTTNDRRCYNSFSSRHSLSSTTNERRCYNSFSSKSRHSLSPTTNERRCYNSFSSKSFESAMLRVRTSTLSKDSGNSQKYGDKKDTNSSRETKLSIESFRSRLSSYESGLPTQHIVESDRVGSRPSLETIRTPLSMRYSISIISNHSVESTMQDTVMYF